MAAPDEVVNISQKLATFSDHWSPKIVAEMNGYHFKVARVEGEFVWHTHDDTDEAFLVVAGRLTIELADRPAVELGPGELFVVPRGIEHRPVAEHEAELLLIEPAGVVNTGDVAESELAAVGEWI